MTLTQIAVLLGAQLVLTGLAVAFLRRPTGPRPPEEREIAAEAPSRPLYAQLSDHAALASRVAQLEIKVSGLPGLWKEEADRANRAADREEKARDRDRGRRRREASGPDDDAQGADAEAGAEQPMLPLRPHLASSPDHQAVIAETRRALAIQQLASGSKGR